MNIVGLIGVSVLFGAALFAVMGSSSVPTLALVLIWLFFFLMVGAPAATVLALSNVGGRLVRGIATGLNVILIVVWAAGVVQSIVHPSLQIIGNLGAAVFYVWPEVINIRTLRAYGKEMSARAGSKVVG